MTPEQRQKLLEALVTDMALTRAIHDRIDAEVIKDEEREWQGLPQKWESDADIRRLHAEAASLLGRHESTLRAFYDRQTQ